MKIVDKYLLNRRYSFFRDYVEVKKELEKYSNLSSLDRIVGNLESEKAYLNRIVTKNIADMGLFSLLLYRSPKGVRIAKHSLESLSGVEI